MTSDYLFLADIDNQDANKLSFVFNQEHPLYFSLKKLLGEEKELIIDDDYTRAEEVKYMHVIEEDNLIKLEFINKDKSQKMYRFNVVVINIMFDGRSKINQKYKDTKDRLYSFFKQAVNDLINGYHQIDLCELYEKEKSLKKSKHR